MRISSLRRVHQAPGPLGWLRRHLLRVWARIMEWSTRLEPGTLNLHRVTPQLLVGGHVPTGEYLRLSQLGVTSVIDLRAEYCDDALALSRAGVELLHLPAKDHYGHSPEALMTGVLWAQERIASGGQVYCHCEHGVGRGPLMATAVLVAQGWEVTEAYRAVRRARWQVALNDRQLEALAAFADLWAAQASGHARAALFANVPGRVRATEGR